MANATSLSAVLDLGASEPSQDLAGLQALVGSETRALPLRGNRAAGTRTAVFTQHPGGPIEDPHEVVFQTEAPKHLYRCFLEDLAKGRVPGSGRRDEPQLSALRLTSALHLVETESEKVLRRRRILAIRACSHHSFEPGALGVIHLDEAHGELALEDAHHLPEELEGPPAVSLDQLKIDEVSRPNVLPLDANA